MSLQISEHNPIFFQNNSQEGGLSATKCDNWLDNHRFCEKIILG